jgi:hypothetical protein
MRFRRLIAHIQSRPVSHQPHDVAGRTVGDTSGAVYCTSAPGPAEACGTNFRAVEVKHAIMRPFHRLILFGAWLALVSCTSSSQTG